MGEVDKIHQKVFHFCDSVHLNLVNSGLVLIFFFAIFSSIEMVCVT